MEQVKDFNKISDELKAKVPALEIGQTVTFKMLNGTPNPDDEDKKKRPILYGKVQIPMSDRIKDGKNFVNIGMVTEWKEDKPARFKTFVPGVGWDNHFNGCFSLTSGKVEDEELYLYLMLTNWNKDSVLGELRDKTKVPLFELVSAKKDTMATITKMDVLRKAIKLADEMTDKEKAVVLASLNKEVPEDKDALKAAIESLAKDTPDLLLSTYNSDDKETKAIIKNALSKNVLVHDVVSGEVKIGDQLITTIKLGKNGKFLDEMTVFLNTAKNGKDVLDNIKKQLK
jgi:hypothetical protein